MREDVWQNLLDRAEFCLTTGIAPSEYDNMTDDEREAFVITANRLAERNS